MWESRRDFQRVWEGWEAGFMAFHAFQTLSFPRSVLLQQTIGWRQTQEESMSVTHPREVCATEIATSSRWLSPGRSQFNWSKSDLAIVR